MGYRIQYGHTASKEILHEPVQRTKSEALAKWVVAGCIFLTLFFLGRSGCLDFLIPGDKAVTKQAFSTMVSDVQDGKDVRTAITAFCMEILNNAEFPE